MKRFKIKKEPSVPYRETIYREIDITHLSLEDLIQELKGLNFSKVRFHASAYEDIIENMNANYYELESDESFNLKMEEYKKKKAEYDLWYSQNESYFLEQESKEKLKKEKAKEARRLMTKQKSEERIAWLQKELDKELRNRG